MKLECSPFFVVKIVTIPRASRGHSSNAKVNTDDQGFRLLLVMTGVHRTVISRTILSVPYLLVLWLKEDWQ